MLFCSIASGQNDSDSTNNRLYELLTKYRINECNDFAVNACILIPDYYYDGKIDSVNMIIDYIDGHCPRNAFSPLKNLLLIESGDFPEDWCDSAAIDDMLQVPYSHNLIDILILYRSLPIDDSGYLPDNPPYIDFLQNLALNLSLQTDTSSVEHLVCRYYSGDLDYPIARLHNNDFAGYCIQNRYDQRVDYIKAELRKFRSHWQLQTGIWIPNGSSRLLGEKLETGGSIGIRDNSWGVDLTGLARMLNSKNNYFVEINDTLAQTDFFFGYFLGLDIEREIVHWGCFEFEGFAGIGYDGIETSNSENDKEHKTLGAFNFNLGLNNRIFFNKTRNYYLGLKARYNIANHKNKGGSDLSGNSFSLCLTFGKLGNDYAIEQAKKLKMFD